LFFDIVYNQPWKLLCPFLEHALVYTTTGMGVGFCAFTISFTKSKAISVLSVTESFRIIFKIDLAISFASDVVFCRIK